MCYKKGKAQHGILGQIKITTQCYKDQRPCNPMFQKPQILQLNVTRTKYSTSFQCRKLKFCYNAKAHKTRTHKMTIHNATMEKEVEWMWLLGFHFSNISIVYIHVSLVTKKERDATVQKSWHLSLLNKGFIGIIAYFFLDYKVLFIHTLICILSASRFCNIQFLQTGIKY